MFRLLLTIVLIACSIASNAEHADRDKPIALSSDKASFDDVRQIYILEGNALLIKGTMIIRGEKAHVKIDPEGYQIATIFAKPGSLASLRQKRDAGQNQFIQGYAEWIEYDAKKETATLVGQADMSQVVGTKISDNVKGERIDYDAVTEKYVAISNNSVKTILSPRRKDSPINSKR